MTATTIASWLLTYLIHSTVLLGAAWLISRFLGDRRLALQEALLRLALVGGLLSTTLQLGFGVQPLAGGFSIEGPGVPVAASPVVDSPAFVPDIAAGSHPSAARNAGAPWPVMLIVLWCLGSALALLTLGRSIFDLRRLLRTRRFRPAGRIVEHLAEFMGLHRAVRLSTSKAIAVPFATGIRKPEICCPERVCDLAEEHQTGLFAHELAHLARRDPTWQLAYRIGEAALVLQPLNRVVSRRLEEIAEHLTDERAVECTGNRLGLARCLVLLSHWSTSSGLGVPASAFAAGPRLDRRVSRLLERNHEMHKSPAWIAPVIVSLLAATVLILPTVASVSADSPPASQAKTWSTTEDAPADAPSPPAEPAPPDARAPDPVPAAPAPEAVPAAKTAPSPESPPEPATAPSKAAFPAPAIEPAPAAQPQQSTPPSPPTAPEPRREDHDPRDCDHAERNAEERAQRALEAHERALERAQRAMVEDRIAALKHHERLQQREREAHRAALVQLERARERARISAERRLENEERAFRMQAEVQARAQERAQLVQEDQERIQAREQRLQERAAIMAKEAEKRADEQRIRAEERAIERERFNQERARQLAERARKMAEEAERLLLEERDQKDD